MTSKLRAGALVAALMVIAAAPCARADVGRASDGHVYFHRAGATMQDHHAALVGCVNEAKALRWTSPTLATKKLADRLVADHFVVDGARRQLRANIENCMVADGWEVVQLAPADGERLAGLAQPDLEAALGSLVGAANVTGQIVRRFAPVSDYFNGQFYLDRDASVTSLSVLADAEASGAVSRGNSPESIYAESSHTLAPARLLAPAAPERLTPTSSLIVVRATAEERGGFDFMLARVDEDEKGAPKFFTLAQGYAHRPKRVFDKFGPDQILVYEAPPGRWRLISTSVLSFCLGAPVFELRAGEAVYAGAFRGKPGSPLVPDMSLDEVKSTLPAGLAGRLKPAAWADGGASQCGVFPQPYSYFTRLEFPVGGGVRGPLPHD